MTNSTGGNIGTGDVPAVEGRIDGPEIIPDILPSVDQISLINTPNQSAEVDGVIAGCQELADKLATIVRDDIEKHIGDAETNIKAFHAAILGDIDHDLAAVADTIAKCDGKITKQLSDEFKNAWDSSFAAGVSPPTDAQIEAALSGQPIPDDSLVKPVNIEEPPSVIPTLPQSVVDAINGGITQPAMTPISLHSSAPPVQSQPAQQSGSCDGFQGLVNNLFSQGIVLGAVKVPYDTSHLPIYATSDGGQLEATSIINTGMLPTACAFSWKYVDALGVERERSNDFPPPVQPPPQPERPPCDGENGNGQAESKPPPELGKASTFCDPTQWVNADKDIGFSLSSSADSGIRFADILGVGKTDTDVGIFDGIVKAAGLTLLPGKVFFDAVFTGVSAIYDVLIAPNTLNAGCTSGPFIKSVATEALYGFAERWLGIVPRSLYATQQYTANYLCQFLIPTGGELNAVASRGYITNDEWQYGIKANGLCLPWQERLKDASYQRIGIRDAYRLWKLEKISDDEFEQAWKRNGIQFGTDSDKFKDAQLQYPGMADLIRMMVRDVADKQVVEDLGLDEEFEDKWIDQLKQWGEAQGVSDDIARMNWRAHWQNPSPQQIFEWLHRLRPDDRDPNDPNSETIVDPQFARKLLQVADYMPGTLDAYIATSYRPYTRVDIRRMWRVGVFDSIDAVRRAYRDLGSDAEHAQNLAEFTLKTETPARAKLAGVMPVSEALKAYTDGLMSQKEVTNVLQNNGLDDEQVAQNLATADDRRQVFSRKKRRDYVKKRFFMGEFDTSALSSELIKAGIPDDVARATADLYIAERDSRRKEPTVAMLCTWFDKGLISLDNYMQRIRNLGFNEADGLKVVEACQIGIKERQFKELEKEQAKQLKAEQARNREAAKALRAAAAHRRLTHTITTTDGKRSVKDTDSTTQQVS